MSTVPFFPFTFFKNSIIETEKAVLPVMTNAVQYGTGVIGGMRGFYDSKTKKLSVFRMDDHFKRFVRSIKLIGTEISYTEAQLKQLAIELIQKNKPETDMYLRPYAFASSLNLQPNFNKDSHLEVAMYMMALANYLPAERGLSVMISAWRRISDNALPSRGKLSGGYISSAMATGEANKRGFDEAIMLNEQGHAAEGSAENLFIVRDGVLITSAKSEEILEGITRRTVLEMAKDLGIPCEERAIDRTELYIADEVFFTGTAAQVSWIEQIDGRIIGDGTKGPISTKLHELFMKVVRGQEKKYQHLCTEIAIH